MKLKSRDRAVCLAQLFDLATCFLPPLLAHHLRSAPFSQLRHDLLSLETISYQLRASAIAQPDHSYCRHHHFVSSPHPPPPMPHEFMICNSPWTTIAMIPAVDIMSGNLDLSFSIALYPKRVMFLAYRQAFVGSVNMDAHCR